MVDHASFRQRLDAVLRTLDVEQVQDFLIAENQWSVDVPENPEFAMWLMIAGSATLKDLHGQARAWLVTHGHQEEANAILGKGQKQHASSAKKSSGHSRASTWEKGHRSSSAAGSKKRKKSST